MKCRLDIIANRVSSLDPSFCNRYWTFVQPRKITNEGHPFEDLPARSIRPPAGRPTPLFSLSAIKILGSQCYQYPWLAKGDGRVTPSRPTLLSRSTAAQTFPQRMNRSPGLSTLRGHARQTVGAARRGTPCSVQNSMQLFSNLNPFGLDFYTRMALYGARLLSTTLFASQTWSPSLPWTCFPCSRGLAMPQGRLNQGSATLCTTIFRPMRL